MQRQGPSCSMPRAPISRVILWRRAPISRIIFLGLNLRFRHAQGSRNRTDKSFHPQRRSQATEAPRSFWKSASRQNRYGTQVCTKQKTLTVTLCGLQASTPSWPDTTTKHG